MKNLLVHEAQEVLATSLGQEDSPGGGTGNPLQYPCLGNALDGGAWWAPVRGVRQDRGLSRRAPLPCSEPEQQEGLRREARPGPPSGGDPGEVRWAQGGPYFQRGRCGHVCEQARVGVCERVSCVPRVCPCHPGERGSPRQEAGSWRIQVCSPGRSFCIHQEAPGLIQRPTVVDAGERWGGRGRGGAALGGAPGQRSDLGGASSRGTCPLGGSDLQGAASGQERAPGGRAGSWGLRLHTRGGPGRRAWGSMGRGGG